MWPHTCARGSSRDAALARVSSTSSLPHLHALASSRLPPVRLSQDTIDQCLQKAPKKNDLVSKRLSHLS